MTGLREYKGAASYPEEDKAGSIRIELNLQFFASAESEGRTEQATSKKRQDARKEGQVAKSTEIPTAFTLLILFWSMKIFGGMISRNMEELFYFSLMLIQDSGNQFTIIRMTGLVVFYMSRLGFIIAPIFAVAFVVGFITSLVQVGWHPTTKPLKPKFSKLNPKNGFKKLFSIRALIELPKSLLKVALIMLVMYLEIKKSFDSLMILLDMDLQQGLIYLADLTIRIGMKVGAWYMIIAAADYAYNRYKHNQDLKMTKQQVKDEYKNAEGDPKIKAKIRQKMREVSMRRMMQDVPSADVIITNPTHYAVAIKYDREKSSAPVVVAKGVDFMAERIKKIAKENKVHIIENRHLARTLYSAVEIGQEIPEELYQSVAEILAYVYSIKKSAS